MRLTRVVVPPGQEARLDVFLSAAAGLSRRAGREQIANGTVRVNGRRVRKGSRVGPGDVVELVREPGGKLAGQPRLPVRVLFEDDEVIVIDKPSGLPSVALRASDRDTVANFLTARDGTTGSAGLEGGLVHRLDTETSGVMLAARTEAARHALRRQFADGTVGKLYLAVVEGDCAGPGSVDEPIGAVPRRPSRVAVRSALPRTARSAARPALTLYRPLRRYGLATLLEVRISTGVRHQIRAHLASIGHPVLGDRLYGSGPEHALRAPRLLLHASEIRFRRPSNGRALRFRAALPADVRAFLRRMPARDPEETSGR